MSRPRKPTADLERDGTYREDRHGGRRKEPQFSGEPERPPGMNPDAQKFWDLIVPMLISRGVATSVDAPALQSMAEWWSTLRELRRKRKKGPTYVNDLVSASKQFHSIAAKFGLTPVDRAKLEVSDPDPANPFEEYLRKRMNRG